MGANSFSRNRLMQIAQKASKPWVTACLRELSREAAASNLELLPPLHG